MVKYLVFQEIIPNFANEIDKTRKNMEKKCNVRVVGFPKKTYEKGWLDGLSDKERSETALADGDTEIFEDLEEFQDFINEDTIESAKGLMYYYWYFLND